MCLQAVETFGRPHQTMKAVEEMGELMTALVQYSDGRVNRDDVITEIADVAIMLEQLACMFGCDGVEHEYYHKLDRLKDTIDAVHLSDEENDRIVLYEVGCLDFMSYARRDELLARCRLESTHEKVRAAFRELRDEIHNEL